MITSVTIRAIIAYVDFFLAEANSFYTQPMIAPPQSSLVHHSPLHAAKLAPSPRECGFLHQEPWPDCITEASSWSQP